MGHSPYPFDMPSYTPYDTAVNSLTAYALGHELHELFPGTTIKKFFRYPGGYTLELAHPAIPFLHVFTFGREAELVPSSRRIVSEPHATTIASILQQSKIREVTPLGVDRILLFTVTAGRGWKGDELSTARFDMTPAGVPIAVFRGTLSEWYGSPRAARPAAPTAVPSRKPFSILALPGEPPEEIIAGAAGAPWPDGTPEHTRLWGIIKRTARLLVDSVGGLDPVLATVLSRAFGGRIETIWPHLIEIGATVTDRRFKWRRYEFPETGPAGSCVIYPVELPIDVKPIVLNNAFEATELRMEEVIRPAYVRFLRTAALSAARKELRKSERLAERLTADLGEARRAREYRQYGNLLVTNRHLMKRGMEEIAVRDFSGERPITVPLSPRLSPDENIRRYFVRAKKGEKGILIITARKRAAERDTASRRAFIERISGLGEPDELVPLIPRRTIRGRPADRDGAQAPFRRFVIDARHTVLVGRNNKENDLLTHRFAAPGDLWFHAQGVAGSHVILRGASPSTPRKILEQVAAIAAYFSKSRHSSTVPVIYTEKRYVRKPRGSPPGSAVCQRGKTLYVKPSLPNEKKKEWDTDR